MSHFIDFSFLEFDFVCFFFFFRNRGIAATVLILRLKEFDLISKQNETTNSRRKDENKNKNKNKNIAEFEDDLSDDFSSENVDKYFKSFLITKNTAVQQRTKYLKIDDESSKNKNNNSGNRETNKNRNRNRNRNLEGDEVLNFFVKSEKVFSPTLKLNFMLLERTSSTVRLWRSSSSRNNDSTGNIKNDGNNGNSHDTNDNRNDDSNSSGSKDKQDNCDKNNCNKNNCNINNENKNNSCLGLMTVIQGVKKYFNFNFNSKGCIVISDKEVISKKKIFDCYSDNDDYANKNINKNIPNNNNRVTVLNVGSSFFSIYFAATDIRIENGFRGEGNTSKEFRYCKLAQHTNTKNCFNFTDSVSSLDRSLSLLENVVTGNASILS